MPLFIIKQEAFIRPTKNIMYHIINNSKYSAHHIPFHILHPTCSDILINQSLASKVMNERMWKSLSRVLLIVTPWSVARLAPLSTGLSRQKYSCIRQHAKYFITQSHLILIHPLLDNTVILFYRLGDWVQRITSMFIYIVTGGSEIRGQPDSKAHFLWKCPFSIRKGDMLTHKTYL